MATADHDSADRSPPARREPESSAASPEPGAAPQTASVAATSAASAGAVEPEVPLQYTPPPDPLLGSTLDGRYFIEEKLGEGGMGSVYLARHIALERSVALKILHAHYCSKADIVERFLREARAASRIRHENVIDITDFGATPEGIVFFAMEVLEGRDLHETIDDAWRLGEGLPWARSRQIFLQICAALAAAHEHGIIHRDLKPENIYLIEWMGRSDVVKLLDFGIAKLTGGGAGERKLTQGGMLFGTPEYMAPEQARGEEIDHRADIYAMGCILYQLIVGQAPFESENYVDVLRRQLTEAPPVISDECLKKAGAPAELRSVVARALEKEPGARFATMDDLAQAVSDVATQSVSLPSLKPGPGGPVRVTLGAPQLVDAPAARADAAAPAATQESAAVPAGAASLRSQPAATARTAPEPRASSARLQVTHTGRSSALETAGIAQSASARQRRSGALLGLLVVVGVGLAIAGGLYLAGLLGSGDAADAVIGASGMGAEVPPDVSPDVSNDVDDMLAPPAQVHIQLRSQPSGATVLSGAGEQLGVTPLEFDLPADERPVRFRLRLDGHRDTEVELIPSRDTQRTVELALSDGAEASADAADDDGTGERRSRRRRARERGDRRGHAGAERAGEGSGVAGAGAQGGAAETDEPTGEAESAGASASGAGGGVASEPGPDPEPSERAGSDTGTSAGSGDRDPAPSDPAPRDPEPAEPASEPTLKDPFGN